MDVPGTIYAAVCHRHEGRLRTTRQASAKTAVWKLLILRIFSSEQQPTDRFL